jgi:hypothetical protein
MRTDCRSRAQVRLQFPVHAKSSRANFGWTTEMSQIVEYSYLLETGFFDLIWP